MSMTDRLPMTMAGYEKLKADLRQLETEEEPKLAARVAAARSEGDLSENAEYHGARESLQYLHARISELRTRLSRSYIVDTSKLPKDQVGLGVTVVVEDLDFGDQETYTLVGGGEEDYDTGRILVTSPLAQGMLGKKVGEVAEIQVPRGTTRLKIVEIRPEFE
jgi:transcription elongation factor GreA